MRLTGSSFRIRFPTNQVILLLDNLISAVPSKSASADSWRLLCYSQIVWMLPQMEAIKELPLYPDGILSKISPVVTAEIAAIACLVTDRRLLSLLRKFHGQKNYGPHFTGGPTAIN